MAYVTPLCIEKIPNKSDKYKLIKSLSFYDTDFVYRIDAGFVTDLTTFWIEGKHTAASVFHDHALSSGKGFLFANTLMYKVMKALKVPLWYRLSIFIVISIYGIIKENRYDSKNNS